MNVLGIETSCDETSAAIVKDGRQLLSNVVSSSLKWHTKYGGVIPEIASRLQLETIVKVTDSALKEAGVGLKTIKLVCVTSEPGLLGSLVVGVSFAKALSLSLNTPLLGVNHLHSHIYANFLQKAQIPLPFIALIVSGGHTSLFLVEDIDRIKILGQTLDDACGESFDKVAKILGLGYPGGPLIERLAKGGDFQKIKFKCSDTNRPLDFSFSGIKTAVLYLVKKNFPANLRKEDIAASFQAAVINTLIKKSVLVCKMRKINRLVIGGGVAANSRLREQFYQTGQANSLVVHFPPKALCMDNAAMVAGFGYRLFKKGKKSDLALSVNLN